MPDTTLGIFDAAGNILYTDDDSPLGDGLASGLIDIPVEPNGLVEWAVSGYPDFDFDGFDDDAPGVAHTELGAWGGYIKFYDEFSALLGFEFFGPFEFFGGDAFTGSVAAPFDAASYDIYLDNTIGSDTCSCGDVDYFAVSGLTPGTEYEIRVTSADFDSILQAFDQEGKPLSFNDDDPDAGCCLSVVNETADASGNLYFAISEIDDFNFTGDHFSFGFWEIAVSEACGSALGCNEADLAEVFGLLDLADITMFVSAFNGGCP